MCEREDDLVYELGSEGRAVCKMSDLFTNCNVSVYLNGVKLNRVQHVFFGEDSKWFDILLDEGNAAITDLKKGDRVNLKVAYKSNSVECSLLDREEVVKFAGIDVNVCFPAINRTIYFE